MSKTTKSFIEGMGQAIDLGATRAPRRATTGIMADSKALRSDWSHACERMDKTVKTSASSALAQKPRKSK